MYLDCMCVKGHLREAKCHLAMGEIAAAVMSYNKAIQLDPTNNTALTEVINYDLHFGSVTSVNQKE